MASENRHEDTMGGSGISAVEREGMGDAMAGQSPKRTAWS